MTYRELAALIMEEFNDDQLDMDVTVYNADQDEYFLLAETPVAITSEDDVLDADHPYLIV